MQVRLSRFSIPTKCFEKTTTRIDPLRSVYLGKIPLGRGSRNAAKHDYESAGRLITQLDCERLHSMAGLQALNRYLYLKPLPPLTKGQSGILFETTLKRALTHTSAVRQTIQGHVVARFLNHGFSDPTQTGVLRQAHE